MCSMLCSGMPAVTIYLDPEMARRAKREARLAKKSLSSFIKERLSTPCSLPNGWPPGYFETVFGALADVKHFEAPKDSFAPSMLPLIK